MVKRYEEGGYGLSNMEESANGSWVDYDSHLMFVMGMEQLFNDKIAELQRERDALAAEMSVVDAIHDKCIFITDDDYDACPKSVQEIIRSLAVMQIPAAEAYRNSVRAEGVDMVAEAIGSSARQLKVGSKDWMALKKVIFTLVGFSAKLRAAAAKGGSNAE